jgi:hypothetical protein
MRRELLDEPDSESSERTMRDHASLRRSGAKGCRDVGVIALFDVPQEQRKAIPWLEQIQGPPNEVTDLVGERELGGCRFGWVGAQKPVPRSCAFGRSQAVDRLVERASREPCSRRARVVGPSLDESHEDIGDDVPCLFPVAENPGG